jgi:chromosome partitioning protein
MVGLRRHRRLERQQPPPAPAPAETNVEASPAPDESAPSARPTIALVPDPPDRVFDQDDVEAEAATEATGDDGPAAATASSETESPDPHGADADTHDESGAGAPVMTVVDTEVVEIEVDEIEDAEIVDDEARDETGSETGEKTAVESDGVAPGAPVTTGEDETVSAEARTGAEPDDSGPRVPIPGPGPNEGPILDPESLPSGTSDEAATFELPRVIAIANQKGGVGKTTTAVNLGAALAELDFRVLVVDLDPQGNASTGLGINPRDVETSVYDALLNDVALEDVVEPTTLRNLFVAPATIDLAGAEIELVPAMSRELRLKRAIDQVRPDYDLVLIDCPPSLGLLTVNGLAAADDVIVPIQCEYYALEGLGQLLRNVGLVQSNLNQDLDVRGIILTMYDARTKLADQVESEVRNYFGPKVYRTVVPRTVRLSEAPSFGQPIIVFDPTSRGASAYRELAKEVSRGASKRSR